VSAPIFLVRHGLDVDAESDPDQHARLESRLCPAGVTQMESVSVSLKFPGRRIVLLASPVSRAVQSGRILEREWDCVLAVSPLLSEWVSPKSWSRATSSVNPEAYREWRALSQSDSLALMSGGEPIGVFMARIRCLREVLRRMSDSGPWDLVCAVTHKIVIGALLDIERAHRPSDDASVFSRAASATVSHGEVTALTHESQ
jgi:broad specificity phosphatase PhoE